MESRLSSLTVFVLLVVLTAAMGGQFSGGDWYASLYKPGWAPPAWMMAPAWSLYFLLLAVSAWLVWCADHPRRETSLYYWLGQLVFSVAWPWLFFGLNRPGWALGCMSLLIVTAFLTWMNFRSIHTLAANLLMPVLAWLGFVWVLNLTLWLLNGGGMGSVFD